MLAAFYLLVFLVTFANESYYISLSTVVDKVMYGFLPVHDHLVFPAVYIQTTDDILVYLLCGFEARIIKRYYSQVSVLPSHLSHVEASLASLVAAASKENGPELIRIIGEEFAKHTQAEMVEILTKADIAHERIQHVKDVLDDPQALENCYVVPVPNADGTSTKLAMTPIRFAEREPESIQDIAPTLDRPAPLIGEHSSEILREYGYTEEEIAQLTESGVVAEHKLPR